MEQTLQRLGHKALAIHADIALALTLPLPLTLTLALTLALP